MALETPVALLWIVPLPTPLVKDAVAPDPANVPLGAPPAFHAHAMWASLLPFIPILLPIENPAQLNAVHT